MKYPELHDEDQRLDAQLVALEAERVLATAAVQLAQQQQQQSQAAEQIARQQLDDPN